MVYIIPEKIMTMVSRQQLYSMIQHQELNEFIGKGTIDAIQGGYDWVSAVGGNIPILGKAFSIGDAISAGIDVAQGQYKDAAFRGAMAGVGLIPGAGGAAKTALKIGGAAAKAAKASKATGQGVKAVKAVTKAQKAAKAADASTEVAKKADQAKRVADKMTPERLGARAASSKKPVRSRGVTRGGLKQGLFIGRSLFGNQPGDAARRAGGMGSNVGAGSATGYRGRTTQFKTRARQVKDELQQAA